MTMTPIPEHPRDRAAGAREAEGQSLLNTAGDTHQDIDAAVHHRRPGDQVPAALDRDRITAAVRELLHGLDQSDKVEVLRASLGT